ncbi:MAG: hypothetical protein D6815_09720, partial [Candidatus Dadabacteria bacterium]
MAWAFRAELTWTAVAKAAGYFVYVRQAGDSYGPPIDAGPQAADSAGEVRYVVAGLPLGPTLYFRVSSYDATGKESEPSNELSLTYAQVAAVLDSDGDGLTNAEEDKDLDGMVDPGETNPFDPDTDGDGLDDGVERALGTNPLAGDTDGDGVGDAGDNCPLAANAGQADADADGWGDACDDCPAAYNPDQLDLDASGEGDVCDVCALSARDDCDASASASATIGPAGADLITPGAGLLLEIPAGAIPEPTSVSLTTGASDVGLPAGSFVASTVVGPPGLAPVGGAWLSIAWPDADGDGFVDGAPEPTPESDLRVWLDGLELGGPCGAPAFQLPACTKACCDPLANRWRVALDWFGAVTVGREVCGNGVVGPSEECDDGNTVDGDCCSSRCRYESAGSPCDDGDPCTTGDGCY